MSGEQYNILCEHVPYGWQSDPILVQRFNALRVISIVQIVYIILEYAKVTIVAHQAIVHEDLVTHYLQTYGGLSFITIIAAIALRFRGDAETTLKQVKVYTAIVTFDLILWGVKCAYTFIHYYNNNWSMARASMITLVSNIAIAGLLLCFGLVEGMRVIRKATTQQYSLLSDGREDSPSYRASLHYYPIRRLALLQMAFTVYGVANVIAGYIDTRDIGVYLLIIPSAGVFTLVAGSFTFLRRLGKSLLTYYAILLTVDLITGLLRVAAGIMYESIVMKSFDEDSADATNSFIGTIALNTSFPVFYWLFGIVLAYRTRMHINLDSSLSSELDRVFGI